MKRINNVYNDICSIENIRLAIYNSSKNKRHRSDVKQCLDNIEETAIYIQKLLCTKTYKPIT